MDAAKSARLMDDADLEEEARRRADLERQKAHEAEQRADLERQREDEAW